MGLNHLQSLICIYSADDLRPLMGISKMVMFNEFPPKRATFPQTAHTFGRFHSTL